MQFHFYKMHIPSTSCYINLVVDKTDELILLLLETCQNTAVLYATFLLYYICAILFLDIGKSQKCLPFIERCLSSLFNRFKISLYRNLLKYFFTTFLFLIELVHVCVSFPFHPLPGNHLKSYMSCIVRVARTALANTKTF